MNLADGLEILVEDWQGLHEDGGTKQTAEQVVARLDVGGKHDVTPGLAPGQVAELIMKHLRKIPGAHEKAEEFMEQFEGPEDLLDETDLDCLVSDLAMLEDDDLHSA
jgi:hypothetical protein